MSEKEAIKVYVKFVNGRTVCICKRSKHGNKCCRYCIPDVVERDRFRGWEDTFKQDKYGKSKSSFD